MSVATTQSAFPTRPSSQAARRRIPRDILIAGAILVTAGVTIAGLPASSGYPLAALLVGVAAGSLVMVLDSAVWAVVPLLVVEFSIRNYQFGSLPAAATSSAGGAAAAASSTAAAAASASASDAASAGGITLRLVAILVALVLSTPYLLRLGPAFFRSHALMRVIVPAIVLIVLAVAFDMPRVQQDAVIKYLRYQGNQLSALVLVAVLIRRPKDVRVVLTVALTLVLASAALAVWQFASPETAPLATPMLNAPGPLSTAALANRALRAVGLSESPIQLAGTLSLAVPILFGLLACGGLRSAPLRWGLWVSAGLLAFATYLTYTRAAVLAIGAGLGVMVFLFPLEYRLRVWTVLGALATLYLVLQDSGVIGQRYYQGVGQDASAAQHLALLQVALAIAIDNPVTGIGHGQFQGVSTGYTGQVSADAQASGGLDTLGVNPPHDDFLMVWVSWGLPALAAFIALLFGALANTIQVAVRSPDGLVRGTAIGLFGALVSYAVNSLLHNYLDSSMVLWLCAGLSIALVRLPVRSHLTPRAARAY